MTSTHYIHKAPRTVAVKREKYDTSEWVKIYLSGMDITFFTNNPDDGDEMLLALEKLHAQLGEAIAEARIARPHEVAA
jgi:hypothetical protein